MPRLPLAWLLALVLPWLCVACAKDRPPFGTTDIRSRSQPTTDTGVRATIIPPGSSVPTMGSYAAGEPGGSGGRFTSLGGASSESESERRIGDEDWIGNRAVRGVGGAVAAPFKKGWDWIRSGDDAQSRTDPQAPPARPPTRAELEEALEREHLERMQSELEQRQGAASAPPSRPSSSQGSSGTEHARAAPSIGEELAQLQARWAPGESPAREVAYAPPPPGTPPTPAPLADRVMDADGDGRPDHWTYLRDGRPDREVFDDDGDGRADRTVTFDPATGEIASIEEDTDRDGRSDSWAEYRAGRLVRRRTDTRGDGFVDSWIYYADGRLVRQEQDTNGDGFRDRTSYYEAGRLVRAEEDADADGRADVVTRFDAQERPLVREEDRDGDGRPDVRTRYENGRLARREVLDPDAAGVPVEGPGPAREVVLPSLDSLRLRE